MRGIQNTSPQYPTLWRRLQRARHHSRCCRSKWSNTPHPLIFSSAAAFAWKAAASSFLAVFSLASFLLLLLLLLSGLLLLLSLLRLLLGRGLLMRLLAGLLLLGLLIRLLLLGLLLLMRLLLVVVMAVLFLFAPEASLARSFRCLRVSGGTVADELIELLSASFLLSLLPGLIVVVVIRLLPTS